MTVDWKICSDCETIECVDSCAAGALKQCVRFLSVDELMKILMRDFPNRGSDGGVTFSDGEPLLHHEFLDQVLQRCRKEKMYTAIGLYEINLLRFHRMGATKWEQRGKKYEYSDHGDMPEERMLELQERYLNMILPAILERILRSKFIIYTVLKISLRCLAKEFFIDPAYIAIFIEVHTMKKSFLRIN